MRFCQGLGHLPNLSIFRVTKNDQKSTQCLPSLPVVLVALTVNSLVEVQNDSFMLLSREVSETRSRNRRVAQCTYKGVYFFFEELLICL
jgi:hypothetical protein